MKNMLKEIENLKAWHRGKVVYMDDFKLISTWIRQCEDNKEEFEIRIASSRKDNTRLNNYAKHGYKDMDFKVVDNDGSEFACRVRLCRSDGMSNYSDDVYIQYFTIKEVQ